MFKVLYAPFPKGLVGADRTDYAVLVYEGKRGTRVMIRSLASNAEERENAKLYFSSAAQDLNGSPSLEFTKLLLGSIQEAWIWAEDIREHWKINRLHQEGRNPRLDGIGQGGSGFDGYW